MKIINNQKGYVISMVTFLVMMIMLAMAMAASLLVVTGQKKIANTIKSSQSYYAAEAGIEDALLRLKNTPAMSPLTYPMTINNASVTVTIPSTVGSSKSILSQSTNSSMLKTIKTDVAISNGGSSFSFYGVEVGAGGLTMSGSSEVDGTVFSSGNISSTSGATIYGDVIISGNGNGISSSGGGIYVKPDKSDGTKGGNVTAYSCAGSSTVVSKNLTYVTGGTHTCTVKGTTSSQSQTISQQPLPIPTSQITAWKNAAVGSGSVVYNGDYSLSGTSSGSLTGPGLIKGSVTLSNSATLSLGYVEITGNLTLNGSSKLKMTGVIHVDGNITLNNSTQINLDSSYSSSGGVLIAGGAVAPSGSSSFNGTGQSGSYVLVISERSSSDGNDAITVAASSSGAAFYTTAGTLHISGSTTLVEGTGYGLKMEGSSKVIFGSGVVNIYFASGPGGGWKVTSWQEQ